MLIKFDEIDWKELPNFKGGEKSYITKMIDDDKGNKIMYGKLEPGASIGYHQHVGNCEMVYIISGHGIELVDDGQVDVNPGECHYCEEGHSHSLINNTTDEDLIFFAVVPKQ